MLNNRDAVCAMDSGGTRDRGRFRHVQPNRGPTKRGPPQKDNFFSFFTTWYGTCVSAPAVSGEGSREGGVTGYSYIRAPTFFLNSAPLGANQALTREPCVT